MRDKKLNISVLMIAIAVCMAWTTAFAQEPSSGAKDWEFSATIYAWAAGLEGETATGDDIDIGVKDILKNLDLAFMGEFGVTKGKWGFLTDILYLSMKDDSNQSLNQILTLSEVEIEAWVVTPMVTYRVIQSDRWTIDFLAGARYLHLEPSLEIDTPLETEKSSDSGDTLDGIVGTRGKVNLNHNWYLPFNFNVGTGDSKSTWVVAVGVGYKFKSYDLLAGYRHMAWNFDDNDHGGEVFNDLVLSGPVIGATFRF